MTIQKRLNELEIAAPERGQLATPSEQSSIPAVEGFSGFPSQDLGQGIASPLTELTDDVNKRVEVDAFDDFQVWRYKAVTKIAFEDANGSPVVFKQIDPNTGEVPA